jgi:hypothetical protein
MLLINDKPRKEFKFRRRRVRALKQKSLPVRREPRNSFERMPCGYLGRAAIARQAVAGRLFDEHQTASALSSAGRFLAVSAQHSLFRSRRISA